MVMKGVWVGIVLVKYMFSECQCRVPLQPPGDLPVFWPLQCRQPHPLPSMSATWSLDAGALFGCRGMWAWTLAPGSFHRQTHLATHFMSVLPAVDHGLIDSSRTSRWGRETISWLDLIVHLPNTIPSTQVHTYFWTFIITSLFDIVLYGLMPIVHIS